MPPQAVLEELPRAALEAALLEARPEVPGECREVRVARHLEALPLPRPDQGRLRAHPRECRPERAPADPQAGLWGLRAGGRRHAVRREEGHADPPPVPFHREVAQPVRLRPRRVPRRLHRELPCRPWRLRERLHHRNLDVWQSNVCAVWS